MGAASCCLNGESVQQEEGVWEGDPKKMQSPGSLVQPVSENAKAVNVAARTDGNKQVQFSEAEVPQAAKAAKLRDADRCEDRKGTGKPTAEMLKGLMEEDEDD
eukprot:TRINITY_DN68626_c0_g1_i1.p3 TRINITY_DN68626_c0_g1~~TRINITY_DN68626_c0_g1_i1.p3  ORF type:complete len:103 (+),score=31.83 TRINITY_DN68626_c0_g1_i1:61-369(+)